MKKSTSILLLIAISFWIVSAVNAAPCQPSFNGNRTVEATCNFNQSAKIYWDIIVWDKTVTVDNTITMWIDLSVNKITFTTWKILFTGSAKANNSVSARYALNYAYSEGAPISTTPCPAWMKVANAAGSALVTVNPGTTNPTPGGYYSVVASNGTMSCGW